MTKMKPVIRPNLHLIYVSDIEKSTAFYEKLFEEKPVFMTPRYVAFSAGGDVLFALWTGGEMPEKNTPRYSEIGICVPTDADVETVYNQWKENAELKFTKDLHKDVFGLTFMIEDPDGHMIRVSPVD